MLPEQPISFPEFVADQLLTAKNLNDLFHYLDVQERGTRINLIGIGIVCGLELKVNTAGTEVTITKGCGITSQGYLVRWDETKFQNYKAYDAAKEIVYDRFFGSGKQKFVIDELKANSSEEGITKLTKTYLEDKVALLFVELLRIDSKNCDPESCDDKGSNITQTIRPLLVDRKVAALLTGGVAGGSSFNQTWLSLPELKMPRHHVPAEDIFDSGDVFTGFQKVIGVPFLTKLEQGLSQAYSRLFPLIKDIYASNPFSGLAGEFAFVHNGTISVQQMLYMQYYYDLFSDVIHAYEEMRKVGMKLLSLCCPDEGLFPRHLLLGATGTSAASGKLDYRHYFIPSPAVSCHHQLADELRSLFRRLVLLLDRFSLQNAKGIALFDNDTNRITNFTRGTNVMPIRITPSKYGNVPLSEKSIPFYYNVAAGADKIYQHWNFARTRNGSADQNLSYHADQYNNGDDQVLDAIQYDLESYNFLRIEGHVGHRYTDALATINQIRDANRLPFDVIALSADIKTLRDTLAGIASSTNSANLKQGLIGDAAVGCHFQDMEALYDTMAQTLICNLCKEMKYYYGFPAQFRDKTPEQHAPLVPLLRKCDPTFRYTDNTLGDAFEEFYANLPQGDYIEPEQFLGGTAFGSFTGNRLAVNNANNNGILLGLALLYYIEKLSEILPTTLISFNISAFQNRYADLMTVAQKVKEFHQGASVASAEADNELAMAISEDVIDHLDSLLLSCRDAQFTALYNDYRIRWVYLAMMQKLGYYVKMHPGIQHKAGVTMGGTFIIVYHERSRTKQPNRNIFTTGFRAKEAQNAAPTQAAANQVVAETQSTKKASDKSTLKTSNTTADETAAQAGTADTQEAIAQSIGTAKANTNASFKTSYQLSTTKLKASLTQKQMAIIDKLFFKDLITKHSLDELTEQLPDKIVIADFYLPYMCCSDCPPIYYIVNETTEDDPEQPTITLKDTQYCGADKTAFPITVTPAGGSFGTSEGVIESNGVFTFNPSAVTLPDDGTLNKVIQLSYTKDGKTASLNVTVFAKPKAAFEVIPATTYNFFVFSNKSERAASIAWNFGDGTSGTGENPSHLYAQDGTYVVTLTATNGVCSDVSSQTVNVVKGSILIDGKEFCSADKSTYPIQTSPEGGNISGEGTSKNANGGFQFKPSTVALTATQSSKQVLLGYSLGSQLVQTAVQVFQTPSASFTITDSAAAGNIKLFKTSNSFQAQYLWDFGDGKTSVEASPAHQFEKPGSWLVKLTVTNGPCKAESTQTLEIAQAGVSIKPTEFCSADKQSYPVTATPLGGAISGEGTTQNSTGIAFNPSAVVFAQGQSQKVISIGYNAGGLSAQTQVVVFRTPGANFIVTPGTASANNRIFSSNVGFAADYLWNFGDGATSNIPNPTHTYEQAGTYTVTLTVSNGKCTATTNQQISVNAENPPPQKACGPLSSVLAAFSGLGKINANLFGSFRDIYKSYPDVEAYFKQLSTIVNEKPEAQIKFFVETGVAALLDKWFTELNGLVENSDVRQIAIALWRVLTMLATYIMCIQAGDFKDNEINLATLFAKLERFIKGWIKFVPNFSKVERDQLQLLLNAVVAERSRVTSNGEESVKKAYVTKLDSIIAILTDYLK
jgi:PKD repeat protein